jgi:hypothetical protein
MAAGAGFYDAEGVWQYGETDNIGTLFSDFMNVAPVSISTQFAADRSRLTTLETAVDNPTVYVAASAAARNAHWGTPTTGSTQLALQNLGATTIRTDTGVVERYFATYNASTNTGGSVTPGWFPVDGSAVFYGTATRTTASGVDYAIGAAGFSYVESFDSLGWHNPSVNPERITPGITGLYRVTSTLSFAANATAYRRAQISVNGGILTGSAILATYTPAVTVVGVLALGATDYVSMSAYQDSGSSLAVTARVVVEFIRPVST